MLVPLTDLTFLRLSELDDIGFVISCGSYNTGNFLILQHEENLLAVSVDKKWGFEIFECHEADQWAGAFIKDIEIRVDPTSFYSTERTLPHRGSLLVCNGDLAIAAKPRGPFGSNVPVLLPIGGMSAGGHTLGSIGIANWTVGKVIDGTFVGLHQVQSQAPES